jgi:hypothetical protein
MKLQFASTKPSYLKSIFIYPPAFSFLYLSYVNLSVKTAGSNPAEGDTFLRQIKIRSTLSLEGK